MASDSEIRSAPALMLRKWALFELAAGAFENFCVLAQHITILLDKRAIGEHESL